MKLAFILDKFEMTIAYWAILLMLISATPNHSTAQSLPDSMTRKIDSLFRQWNNANSPGCAIGIVRNDSLIYAKGYGMANLEYGVPITPETIFHMASVSKQFTAWSIILLAKQGKLALDDDIHKHLPWLPEFKAKITIRQLLNHTSGIRDQWQLLAIAGTRIDDVITQDHITKILGNQTSLNFTPGEQHMYSNSGYTLLAEIVKSVSGQTLRNFSDSAIFRPLGMTNTHFHDNYEEIEKGRAYSYHRVDNIKFANSLLNYSNTGATSLFTNITDLSKWLRNFYENKVGGRSMVDSLTRKGKLNNGTQLNYAAGIELIDYKGNTMLEHGGGDAGYRTFISIFPELKAGFIVLSNLADFNPSAKTMELADLFIKPSTSYKPMLSPVLADTNLAKVNDTAKFKKLMGDYASDDGGRFYFFMKNQKITWVSTTGYRSLLIKADNDTFYARLDPSVKFVFKDSGTVRIVDEYWPGNHRRLEWYDIKAPVPDNEIKEYLGEYYSPELNATYNLIANNNRLVLTNSKYPDAQIYLAGRDRMFTPMGWMSYCKFIRNKTGRIDGFEVNTGRVMHLRFNKKVAPPLTTLR